MSGRSTFFVVGSAVLGGVLALMVAAMIRSGDPEAAGDERLRRIETELGRLADAAQKLELGVRRLGAQMERRALDVRAPSETPPDARPAPAAAPAEGADKYAAWSDDELFVAARGDAGDLGLLKAALQRGLGPERRAQVLLSLAAFYRRLDANGALERDALREAAQLAPPSTATGARAMLEFGNALAADKQLRWQATQNYEAVRRDAPDETRRMQAAYRLAWLHDLGDDPPAVALEAFKKFLADWGEKWRDTPEASWARQRVATLEGKQ